MGERRDLHTVEDSKPGGQPASDGVGEVPEDPEIVIFAPEHEVQEVV